MKALYMIGNTKKVPGTYKANLVKQLNWLS